MRVSISQIPKPGKDNARKCNYRPISLISIDTIIFKTNASKPSSATHKMPWPKRIYLRNAKFAQNVIFN